MLDSTDCALSSKLTADVQKMMLAWYPADFETIQRVIRERMAEAEPYCIGIKSKQWVAVLMSIKDMNPYLIEIPESAREFYNHW